MKLDPETLQSIAPSEAPPEPLQFELPFGLIGLGHLRHFELTPVNGGAPFFRLATLGAEEEIQFLAVKPEDAVPGYQIELSDEDTDSLRIESADNAMILNIVTVHSSEPQHVTVNLIGPVVVNRQTRVGKQVIIENSDRYSALHALSDLRLASPASE